LADGSRYKSICPESGFAECSVSPRERKLAIRGHAE
jgi:hypothetical protein